MTHTVMEIQPASDLPRLRDRVTVAGEEGVYIVIASNSSRREVDLAGACAAGYLFHVPVAKILLEFDPGTSPVAAHAVSLTSQRLKR